MSTAMVVADDSSRVLVESPNAPSMKLQNKYTCQGTFVLVVKL